MTTIEESGKNSVHQATEALITELLMKHHWDRVGNIRNIKGVDFGKFFPVKRAKINGEPEEYYVPL